MRLPLLVTVGLLMLLGACTEKPQTMARKADGKPWENSDSSYLAKGYKPGDAAAWDNQIKQRNQSQNEYSRTNAKP